MSSFLDTLAALRVAYILVTPIENTEAYKLGLLDISGKTIRKAETSEEKNSTSALHRLVWNLKRIIGLIPGGKTRIGSLAAAYLLMREAVENNWTEERLTEETLTRFNDLCESECMELDLIMDKLIEDINEDAPANSSGVPVATDTPTNKLADMQRRKKLRVLE